MIFTESMLESYSQPLSDTEDRQCRNAIRMVADALAALGFTADNSAITPLYPDTFAYSLQLHRSLDSRKIKLFVQGSYANNTNVRTGSDVDVAVIQEEVFHPEYRDNPLLPQSGSDYGFTNAPVAAKSFKDEVQEALEDKFNSNVERKNKSIKIHGNSYRKDADTFPCCRYRDYRQDFKCDKSNYVGGVVIYPDNGGMIINYPEQHIANGQKKNVETNHHYKKMVRIMKKMRYLMEGSGNSIYRYAAEDVSSFMLESLLWNVEESWYTEKCGSFKKVFAFQMLISTLQKRKGCFRSYKEANGIKPLCSSDKDCEHLCVFLDRLVSFYEFQ